MLIRILNALSNAIPELGYVQGMNFITASLLVIVNDELDTFILMHQILTQIGLKEMYVNSFSYLQKLCKQLDFYI